MKSKSIQGNNHNEQTNQFKGTVPMHIISKPKLREFWSRNPEAKTPLLDWYKQSKRSGWENLVEVRQMFPHADSVGKCTVFNIGGNKYRLITKINYKTKVVYVRFVLAHKEYDEDKWKNDCF